MSFKRENIQNILTLSPFLLLGVIIVTLIIKSFIGKSINNPVEAASIYTTPLSLILWGTMASIASYLLIKKNKTKNFSRLLFHLSLIVILLGGGITHFTHDSGIIHLRQGIQYNEFTSLENNRIVRLPFKIKLSQFNIINYPGTTTPADYESIVCIEESANNSFSAKISMNNILNHNGYRFFQTNFDTDLMGTVLTISYDKWGGTITYIGYGLLFFSILLLIIDPNGKFRQLLRNGNWKTFLLFLFIFLSPFDSNATVQLSENDLKSLGEILIQHQGRITTLENFATDFTRKIYEKKSYKGFTAIEVLFGWILSPEEWQHEPMFKIQSDIEKRVVGRNDEYVKFTDFFNSEKHYKIENHLSKLNSIEKKEKEWEKLRSADEKVQLIFMLQSESLLKIFPIKNGNNVELITAKEIDLDQIKNKETLLSKEIFTHLIISAKNGNSCNNQVTQLKKIQLDVLKEMTPSKLQLKTEHIYLQCNYLSFAAYITLAFGIIAFILLCFQLIQGIKIPYFHQLSTTILSSSYLYLTFLLVLRVIISERLPLSNGHETLLTIAWLAQIIALSAQKKVRLSVPFGLLISGLALLASTLSEMNPKITPLTPILNSPLLSIHVSFMMIAYTLIGFITTISLLTLTLLPRKKKNMSIANYTLLNRLLLYPTIFFLTAGIFIGAIWANISWGNYWSWDPKETWALISMLYYAIAIHNESLPFLRKPLYFHLYLLVGCLLILTTYFGVNYFFGGMHSYV